MMLTKLQKAWVEAAEALEIRIEAPSFFKDADSKKFEVSVRILDFGGAEALLLFSEGDSEEACDAAYKSRKYSISMLGPNAYESFSREPFIELLSDWGWSGAGEPPCWYQDRQAEQGSAHQPTIR